jgi:DNA-binding response OmpR family regulator
MKCTLPVLVVEDSFLIAASLEDALLEAGHPVTLARSVAEAEAAMADTEFAAALLDYMLPDGDSLSLARQLHASGCKVAVVSGVDREVVPSDGAIAALFDKPTDERDLIAWVGEVTGTPQAKVA